jgi:hypothetical protein
VKVSHTTRIRGVGEIHATTERHSLRAKHFGDAAMRINRATAVRGNVPYASRDRGLYYVDRSTGELLAALAFHVPRNANAALVVRALAVRVDRPDLLDVSQLGCLILTIHLQAASYKLRRKCDLLAYPSAAEEDRFREALFGATRGERHDGRAPWAQPRFGIFDS